MEQQQQKTSSYVYSDWPNSVKKLQNRNVFQTNSQVLSIRFDPEDTMIAAGCSDGFLKVFHLHSGSLKMDVDTSADSKNSSPCTSMRWRPPAYSDKTKNILLTGSADGRLIHWHVTTGKQISSIQEENNQINSLDFNTDGTQFVTGGQDSIVRIYDEETNQALTSLKSIGWKEAGHNNRIFCVKFIPEHPHLVMSGGWDMNVHFWDQREKKAVKSFLGPKVSGESLDFKENQVLTGSNTGRDQLAIWDFDTCKKIRDIDWEPESKKENGAFVYGCQFSKTSNESILVGAHGVNSARIFDVNNNYLPFGSIEGLQNGIYTVDYGNYSNKFAASGGDGLIFISSLTSD